MFSKSMSTERKHIITHKLTWNVKGSCAPHQGFSPTPQLKGVISKNIDMLMYRDLYRITIVLCLHNPKNVLYPFRFSKADHLSVSVIVSRIKEGIFTMFTSGVTQGRSD